MIKYATQNTFGQGTSEHPYKDIPVWLGIEARYPVGATLQVTGKQMIPAGTPVSIDKLGGTATVLNGETAVSGTPVGLTESPIYSDETCMASVTIVTKGTVLIDRCPVGAKEALAKLPGIVGVSEGAE